MAQAEEAYDGPRKLRLDQMQKTRSRSSRQSEVPDVLPPANNFKEDEGNDTLKWLFAVGTLLVALLVVSNMTSIAQYRNYYVAERQWDGVGRHPGMEHFQVGAKPPRHLGEHLIVEMWGVEPKLLATVDEVKPRLVSACEAGKFTVLGQQFHGFSPHGVTGVFLLAESHLSIHTWPEYGYAAVDVFTCGVGENTTTDTWKAAQVLKDKFNATTFNVKRIQRGMPQTKELPVPTSV